MRVRARARDGAVGSTSLHPQSFHPQSFHPHSSIDLGVPDAGAASSAVGPIVAPTGATSFLGRNPIGVLEEDPRVTRVVSLDVRRPATAREKTRRYEVDLTRPYVDARVTEILTSGRAGTLLHLAFLSTPTAVTARAHELESVGTRACRR